MKPDERREILEAPFVAVDEDNLHTLALDGHQARVDFAMVSMRYKRSGVAYLSMELSRDQLEELSIYLAAWCEEIDKSYLGEDWEPKEAGR